MSGSIFLHAHASFLTPVACGPVGSIGFGLNLELGTGNWDAPPGATRREGSSRMGECDSESRAGREAAGEQCCVVGVTGVAPRDGEAEAAAGGTFRPLPDGVTLRAKGLSIKLGWRAVSARCRYAEPPGLAGGTRAVVVLCIR